jgi:2-keto-4-pentenoate hydratase/2-oxohepta-3-ene-1,7-dioic acid hydratase in catechol pathway
MKLATFEMQGLQRGPRLGVATGQGMVDIVSAARALDLPVPATSVKSAICSGPATLRAVADVVASAVAAGHVLPFDELWLLPPISDPGKFFCVGKNSIKHREELLANGMLKETPQEPTGFIKLAETLVGHGCSIMRPESISTLDYEPELVFVVGKYAHRVAKADALSYIAGITVFNDVTAREIQKREVVAGTRFWTAKNMPGFGPIGPYIVTLDEVEDLDALWLTCHVNGELRLRESTSQYIYKIGDVLEHFSRFMPFQAGDLLAMGATKGVAVGQPNAAELYLKPGDNMEIGIEGLMTLRNPIAD